MKLLYATIFCTLLLSHFTNAQTETLLKQSSIAASLTFESPDSAISIAQDIFPVAEKEGFVFLSISVLNTLASAHVSKGEFQEAISFREQALELALNQDSSALILDLYKELIYDYGDVGNYSKSMSVAGKMKTLADSVGNIQKLSRAYAMIGDNYRNMHQPKEAIQNLEKAIKILQNTSFHADQRINRLNLAIAYDENRQTKKALAIFLDVLSKGEPSLRDSAKTYNNIGRLYTNLAEDSLMTVIGIRNFDSTLTLTRTERIQLTNPISDFASGENYLKEAIQLCIQAKDDYMLAHTRNELATNYKLRGKYKEALEEVDLAEIYAFKHGKMFQKENILRQKSALLAMSGQYKDAYQYAKKQVAFNQQIINEKYTNSTAKMEVEFETLKKEKALLLQEIEIKQRTQERNILFTVGIFILLLAVIVVGAYKKLQNNHQLLSSQKELIEASNQEITLLLKELHHRVKNNLQLVSSILNLQAYKLNDQEAIEAVKEGQARVEAMALIHRDLYLDHHVTSIDIKKYVNDLINNLMYAYGFRPDEVSVEKVVEEKYLSVDLVIPLGLILNELLSNSFKHAFEDIDSPKLTIEIKEDSKQLIIKTADNGSGTPSAKSSENSFGIQMINSLIKQLDGVITSLNEGNGYSTLIQIPLN
ncbi:tetratricopeptide repeat-containing sensor histidine kinase [Sediminitomix flava]|uniref:histidine kinase n=1 Tax=Sediminitomix flava TaxID=379075 RepID=A0A315ZDM6_SEDFL|nr:histidine kinase dimerization/phosphoacceptor domain -containing protein [Sediminitomix flava]PWJ43230.1 two-component sensor histidine kinase [Sediminitomix flava]